MDTTIAFSSTLDAEQLEGYLTRLIANHIPDGRPVRTSLQPVVAEALDRAEHCFAQVHRKYYNVGGRVLFDHLNGDQFATFLYFVANSTWAMTGDDELATKLFSLNKIMHGLDLYFSVSMPETFLLVHPVGSVIGNASYGDYLVVYQNCTIGSDAGKYPRFGEGTILYARSSVLGDCSIGDDVVFAANSFVVNSDVVSNSIVVGQYPQHRVLASSQSVRERLFDEPLLG